MECQMPGCQGPYMIERANGPPRVLPSHSLAKIYRCVFSSSDKMYLFLCLSEDTISVGILGQMALAILSFKEWNTENMRRRKPEEWGLGLWHGQLARGHRQMETKTLQCTLPVLWKPNLNFWKRVAPLALAAGGLCQFAAPPRPLSQMLCVLLWLPGFQEEHKISSPRNIVANSSLPHSGCGKGVTLG